MAGIRLPGSVCNLLGALKIDAGTMCIGASQASGSVGASATSRTSFDKKIFVKTLADNALPPYGQGKCAKYVRIALEKAGLDTTGHPVSARDWGPTLSRLGFKIISNTNYIPVQADIVVMQGTSASTDGHIMGYEGKLWVSDFVQTNGFWPGPSYRNEKPSYAIYRRDY